ncbi:TetR/AcrR family transcriptional regulator [Mycolicibacterium sp. CBMA 226]|uniref:TetR/AcrR family transcriptional regulator n=1 Tax=Mycolicibacterium sp. CBMA 226 TaxID=2606611 RepID=UPI0012DDFFB2|nr:TetR/AcrR family transcriptional regulator [Mycolicibacterium sp. CBMA 226]MUL76376.1 TetR/AcrR family transcriptional regulator [Mycolicibacterium sp. CBMA 226]
MPRRSYHHGDLKSVILAQAAELVAERGADGISLRELARAAGVSHAAPAHHFTDRRGLFTALATEGFAQLAAALSAAQPEFADAARAYVRFALDHPGHYAVMFDRMLYDAADPELRAAEAAAAAELTSGIATLADSNAQNDPVGSALAAWSLVHGFALLTLNDAVTESDPVDTAERLARILFSG